MTSLKFQDPNATPFESLCRFLEKVVMFKIGKKKELFEQLIRQVVKTTDLYPILRLIFPESDASRAAYGLKEHSLGRVFADLLLLPPHEKERLLNWKDPNLQAKHNCTVGDFPSVLLSVIEPRMSTTPSKRLTIGEVNKFLTDLYVSVDTETRRSLFRELIYKARPVEIKWIIKMVLKDMKLSLSVESILRHLHPNAISLYHISNSIQHVLQTISNENVSETSSLAVTSIFFQPVKPMLSERVNPGDVPERFGLMHGEVFLEPKLDGERMLAHVDKRRSSVAIFSRNGIDYTPRYGVGNLSPLLLTCFKGTGAVFDGEMVAWDPHSQRMHAFGTNPQLSRGVEEPSQVADPEPVNSSGHLFYVIFDLIFYVDIDGAEFDLRNTSLEDRKELLEKILIPVVHRVELVKAQKVLCSVDAIGSFLKKALDRREEGIVVKRANSVYKLSVRGMGWFKIKADYDEVYSDSLDLVVLGGYYSEAAASKGDDTDDPISRISSFLVGVPKTSADDGEKKTEFKTVTKVGTGLTQNQMVFVKNRLRNAVVPFGPSAALPEWFGDWRPSKADKPDLLFSPYTSNVVLEVRAGEILISHEFSSGFQLRFPRVLKPRTDKDWTDATSFDDLRTMATADTDKTRVFIQNLGRPFGGHQRPNRLVEKKIKRQKVLTILTGGGAGGTESSSQRLLSDVDTRPLEGRNVFIVNGERAAELVRELGANSQSQFQRESTEFVIAEKDEIRVKNIATVGGRDVLNLDWLLACAETGEAVAPNPDIHILRTNSTVPT